MHVELLPAPRQMPASVTDDVLAAIVLLDGAFAAVHEDLAADAGDLGVHGSNPAKAVPPAAVRCGAWFSHGLASPPTTGPTCHSLVMPRLGRRSSQPGPLSNRACHRPFRRGQQDR